jgi:hypothetical protein
MRIAAVCVAVAALLAVLSLPAQAAPAGPAVLFVTHWGRANGGNEAYLKRLVDEGMSVHTASFDKLTPELLAQFDAVVICALPPVDPRAPGIGWSAITPAASQKLWEMLDGYLAAGGGILFSGPLWGWDIGWGHLEATNAYLKHWDLQVVPELVIDKQNLYRQRIFNQNPYSFTRNLAPSPVSEGVKTVWYPVDINLNGGAAPPSTAALQLGPEWTAVVRGEDTAASYAVTDRMNATAAEKPGLYPKAPPFVAIREAGKGRLGIVDISSVYTIWGYGHPMWEGVVMTEGDGYRKSDTARLFDNLYQWLGAKRDGHTVGGYQMSAAESQGEVPWDWGDAKPIDWTKQVWTPIAEGGLMPDKPTGNMPYGPPALGMKHYRGLIGARTALTGGAGTVAEYVAAAQAAGLHFVIFAEDLEKLTPESWAAFKDQCKQAGSEEFLAVPGFVWKNPVGDSFLMCGQVKYPDPGAFVPGTKRIVTHGAFWFAAGAPMNFALSGKQTTPLWNYVDVNALPVEVWREGKRVEDNFNDYVYDQAREHFYTPVIVNWVMSPQELPGAVKAAPATILLGNNLGDVQANLQRNMMEAERMLAYVTAGPQIAAYYGFNLSRATAGALYVPGTDRWRLRLAAASPDGLREVRIYDGLQVAYRFDAGGKKEFQVDIDGHHDRQHHWLPVVEDVNGKLAVGPSFWVRDILWSQSMDGDRNNHDPFGIQRDQKGRPQVIYQAASHQFIKGQMQVFRPGSTTNQEEFHPAGLDATEYSWFWNPTMDVQTDPAEPPMYGWAERYFTTCSSDEVFIVDQWLDRKYPADDPSKKQFGPGAYGRIIPSEVMTVHQRYLDAFHPYGRPAPVVCEMELKFLKDVTFPEGKPLPCVVSAGRWGSGIWEGQYDHYTISAGGQTVSGALPAEGSYGVSQVPLHPGDYVALYPSLWGSGTIMALSEGLSLDAMAYKGGVMSFCRFQLRKRQFHAGEELTGTLLFVKGSYPEQANNALAESLRTKMGLAGKPVYPLETVRGETLSTVYRVKAKAQNGAWAARIGKADLPVLLPLEVAGLQDNWEAYLYNQATKQLRPIPVCQGTGYVSLDVANGADVIIGHPVTCDQPEVKLVVLETGGQWSVVLHNPTDKSLDAALVGAEGFPGVAALRKTVTVPARSSVTVPAA